MIASMMQMAAAGLGLLSPQLSAVLQEVVDLASIGYSMGSALTYKADTGSLRAVSRR